MWVAKDRRRTGWSPRPCVAVAFFFSLGGGALRLASAQSQSPSPVVLTSPYSVESLTRREIRELECGLYGLSSYFSVAFAGVADTETLCGRCIRISCVDEEACREGTGSLVAAVVDGAGAEEVAVNSVRTSLRRACAAERLGAHSTTLDDTRRHSLTRLLAPFARSAVPGQESGWEGVGPRRGTAGGVRGGGLCAVWYDSGDTGSVPGVPAAAVGGRRGGRAEFGAGRNGGGSSASGRADRRAARLCSRG